MNAFLQTLRSLGPVRLALMGGVAVGLIAFFAFLTSRLNTVEMALLYSDLASADSGAIVQKLDSMKVPYAISNDGAQIKVASDQVGRIRMQLAAQGLPNGGSVGYEIFDQTQAFGTSSFVQNINQLRALEGELARTVGTLGPVRQARIHLVMPKRELFSRQEQPPSASVFLQLRPGAKLGKEQVLSIQHLIAAAVPQLKPELVSIIDDKGALLARGSNGDSPEMLSRNAEEMRRAYEQKLVNAVEDLLSRTLGPGKVRATVNADLDFDRITTNSESFDPDQQVVRSTQSVTEQNESKDSKANDNVSVNNNLPNLPQAPGGGNASTAKNNRNEETINYEIGKTVKSHLRESGQVRRLSVAVVVDGTYAPGADGKTEYKPRSEAELQQIRALIRSATGFDERRGDVLEIANMRFLQEETPFAEPADTSIMGFAQADLLKVAQTSIVAIVGLLVLLLVVRPLLSRAIAAAPAGAKSNADNLLTDQSQAVPALTGPGGSALAGELARRAAQEEDDFDQMIDMNKVEGRVRASSVKKIGDLIDKHPAEAANLIRTWMYQES